MKSMLNDKSPSNDGSIKEFYETSWNELTEIYKDYLSETKEKGHLITFHTSYHQLNRKKYRDTRFIQYWVPISSLNVDLKTLSKSLSEKLKNFFQI